MNICSLSFLYLWMPLMVVACLVTPSRFRPMTLLLCSLGLYWLWEGWQAVGLLLFVLLSDWMLAGLLYKSRGRRRRKSFLIFAVLKNIGLIIGYGIFASHIPLGLFVYCVTSIGYVVDCYHGFALWEKNPTRTLLMGAFLPKLYAGPVVYYSRTVAQFFTLRMSLAHIGQGGRLFLWGLCKKVVLGDSMRWLYEALYAIPQDEISVLGVWAMLVAVLFTVYFSLWGLCDMTKGLACIFGFELPDNFDMPCKSKSINEFFGRFNSTVNRFIRRHVYMTLGGAQGGTVSVICNILVLSILMALWFGLRWNFLAWGIFLALFVLVERFLLPGWWKGVASFFQWFYCILVVLFSMVFFASNHLGEAVGYWKILFSNAPGIDSQVIYLLVSNYLVLAICVLLASGFGSKIGGILSKRFPNFSAIAGIFVNAALFIGVTAYLL